MGLIPDKEQQEAVRRALDPRTVEARMLAQGVVEASDQVQQQVRAMLREMIDLVPGQLFRDIERFHEKFQLPPTTDPGHRLSDDVLAFRIKFMFEELQEYVDAVGGSYCCPDVNIDSSKFNAELALDSLVDLCYVALGTAYLHRFPFNEGWARVQEANMKKVRASGDDDPLSKRKHAKDVCKPPGWVPPILSDLLDEACDECEGRGQHVVSDIKVPGGYSKYHEEKCESCAGTGKRRRTLNIPMGERNASLFKAAMSFAVTYPDNWKSLVEKFNIDRMEISLTPAEVAAIITAVESKLNGPSKFLIRVTREEVLSEVAWSSFTDWLRCCVLTHFGKDQPTRVDVQIR